MNLLEISVSLFLKENFMKKLLPLMFMSSLLFTHVSVNAETSDFQTKPVYWRLQHDFFTSINSCTDEVIEGDFVAVFATFPSSNIKQSDIKSFKFKVKGLEVDGVVVDSDKYYYKDVFGKQRHYEQFNSSDFISYGGGFTFVFYPSVFLGVSTNDLDSLELELYLHDGRVLDYRYADRLKSPNEGKFKSEHRYVFDAEYRNGFIESRLLSNQVGKVAIDYHYSFGGNKVTQGYVVSANDARRGVSFRVSDLKGYKEGTLTYLGVYYESGDDMKLTPVEVVTFPVVENKVELYDSTKSKIFAGITPSGVCEK